MEALMLVSPKGERSGVPMALGRWHKIHSSPSTCKSGEKVLCTLFTLGRAWSYWTEAAPRGWWH